MSWSKPFQILSFATITAISAPLLAACTLTPVYSERGAQTADLELAFAKPLTRIDQVVIQELAFRFGNSTAPTARRAVVSTSVPAAALVNTVTVNPNKAYEVTVAATLTIIRPDAGPDDKPIVLTREATAGYETGAQILNDSSAFTEASERAAKSAAESLRLALLATLIR